MNDLLIFDMDGVLVDVTESYRETIRLTVKELGGIDVTPETVQEFKNRGGFNDDWVLCHQLLRDAGVEIGYDTVVEHFQSIFRGDGARPGLIEREQWIAEDGLWERLGRDYHLAIFTGRLREEADVTLNRFAPGVFHPVIGGDDVRAAKPAPDGLLKIRSLVPSGRVFYFGDTADDAMSAQSASVPFIGVAGARTPRRAETIAALHALGALRVIENINQLEDVLKTL